MKRASSDQHFNKTRLHVKFYTISIMHTNVCVMHFWECLLCEDFCDCIFAKPLPADFMYDIFCMLCQHPEDSDVTDDLLYAVSAPRGLGRHWWSFVCCVSTQRTQMSLMIFCMLCQHPEDSDVTDDLFMGQMRSSPDRQHNYSFHLPPVSMCLRPGLSIRFEQVHSLETKITAPLPPLQVVSHFCFH